MKNACTLAFVLVASALLFASCSQTSNLSLSNSNRQGAYYHEAGAPNSLESKDENANSFQGSDNIEVLANRDVIKDTIDLDITLLSIQQPIALTSDFNKKTEINTTVYHGRQNDIRRVNNTAKEAKNEYSANSVNAQPAQTPGAPGHSSNGLPLWFIVVCAIFIPPLGVALMFGISDKFWICLALTFCFWLPGMIYALIQVLR